MITFLCGMPGSGKSDAARLAHRFCRVIDPAGWLPQNMTTLSAEIRRNFHITAAKLAAEDIQGRIVPIDKPVLVDPACSDYEVFLPVLADARSAGQAVRVIYLKPTKSALPSQASDVANMRKYLPMLKAVATEFLVVDTLAELQRLLQPTL